jgi:hypothetical protein
MQIMRLAATNKGFWIHIKYCSNGFSLGFPFYSSNKSMSSVLDQLKEFTTVVADSGDFESKKFDVYSVLYLT